ncbi:hypothetical protein GC197_14660 [bacterium]|nr:hypothetical protein [bacterium]
MIIWLVGAAFMLFVTVRDILRHRTDTVGIFPWWAWFNVSREKRPFLYWACISGQLLIVAGCLVFAFWTPPGVN